MPRFAARSIARYGERGSGLKLGRQSPAVRPSLISLLTLGLKDYLKALAAVRDWNTVLEAAGIRCPGCATAACAVFHAWRHRKRVTDLTTGEIFRDLPIGRVKFCSGQTMSLTPGPLWRGRYTISSVLTAFVHAARDGIEAACVRASEKGDGEELVSPRTLYRWMGLVRQRFIGSSLAVLLPRVGGTWSRSRPEGPQLEALLSRITPVVLAAFRAAFRRGVIDTALRRRSRQDPERHAPTVPHDPSCDRKAALARSHPRSRRGPPGDT